MMVFIQAEECVWLKNVAEECGDKHEEPVWYPSIVSVRQRKFFNYVTLGIIILLRFHYITICDRLWENRPIGADIGIEQ